MFTDDMQADWQQPEIRLTLPESRGYLTRTSIPVLLGIFAGDGNIDGLSASVSSVLSFRLHSLVQESNTNLVSTCLHWDPDF